MAFRIVRQPKKIALLGSASSVASLQAGHERAPAALRSAGLAERLKAAGFDVVDHGDTPTQIFQSDDEHPRARNVPAVLKSLNDLRPRVEIAAKSGALPLILCGDSIAVLATVAGVRRYYRNVSLIYMGGDAALDVPATTRSGCIDGMVISQVIGRGAPELTRFWGEPPLVREPDVALFGYERLGAAEEQFLQQSPLRRHPAAEVSRTGAAAAARAALERVHAGKHEFVLHLDLDLVSRQDFQATNAPGDGGLSGNEVRDAVRVFARQPNLAAIEVAGYNPDLDPDGQAASWIVDLIVDALAMRLESDSDEPAVATAASAVSGAGPGETEPSQATSSKVSEGHPQSAETEPNV